MDDRAAGLDPRRLIDRIENLQAKNARRIKRIGIAHPAFDGGHRKPPRPRLDRRRWPWRGGGQQALRSVQFVKPPDPRLWSPRQRPGQGLEAQQPAAGHAWRAVNFGGPGQKYFVGTKGLDEIVRGLSDAPLRKR